MSSDQAACYNTLGLAFGASLRQVEKARRTLAKKWHPDLVHDKPNLHRKHEEKLKQINSSADYLVSSLRCNDHHAEAREDPRGRAKANAEREAERHRRAEERNRTRQNRELFAQIQRLAMRGVAEAQYRLATMYRDNVGCVRNKAEALRWFKRAAAKGEPRSALYVGFAYTWGLGSRPDALKAVKLYQLAATKGLAAACFHLGFMSYFGIGIKQDFEQATLWYRKAVEQGYKVSENHPDTCGHPRTETPTLYFKHYKWYSMAVRRAVFVNVPLRSIDSNSAGL